MRNFKPAPMGDSWFDWIGTSPGRIDPESGEFVESTAIPENEREGFFDWVEVTPGRVNPKTGKLVIPTNISKEQREKLKRAHSESREDAGRLPFARKEGSGKPFSRFGREDFAPRALEFQRGERPLAKKEEGSVFDTLFGTPSMSGSYDVGCGPCGGEMNGGGGVGDSGAVLWLFLGTTAVIALEAFGVTHWSQPKQ